MPPPPPPNKKANKQTTTTATATTKQQQQQQNKKTPLTLDKVCFVAKKCSHLSLHMFINLSHRTIVDFVASFLNMSPLTADHALVFCGVFSCSCDLFLRVDAGLILYNHNSWVMHSIITKTDELEDQEIPSYFGRLYSQSS